MVSLEAISGLGNQKKSLLINWLVAVGDSLRPLQILRGLYRGHFLFGDSNGDSYRLAEPLRTVTSSTLPNHFQRLGSMQNMHFEAAEQPCVDASRSTDTRLNTLKRSGR